MNPLLNNSLNSAISEAFGMLYTHRVIAKILDIYFNFGFIAFECIEKRKPWIWILKIHRNVDMAYYSSTPENSQPICFDIFSGHYSTKVKQNSNDEL